MYSMNLKSAGTLARALGLVLVLVLGTLLYPLMMFWMPWHLGPLDMGPVWSGYLGLVLFCAAGVAVGLLVTSLVESQSIAFFITFMALAALWFFDNAAEWLGQGAAANVLRYISFQTRLAGFARGLVDTRDVIYFLSVTITALVISFRALERRKWA